MAMNIRAVIVTGTKLADGNVRLDFFPTNDGLNPTGDIKYSHVFTSADFTAFNTTVNGGATATTLSKAYAEDANRTDYHRGYTAPI